jgi:cell wall-associated NlpC family hydrolase
MSSEDRREVSTGDLLLFRGSWWVSRLIEYFSGSVYSHAGIYVRNPREFGVDLPDGEYVWHSGYGLSEEKQEYIYGVHFEKLEDVLQQYPADAVDVRIVHAKRSPFLFHKLREVHSKVHAKPYDTNVLDWISALYQKKFINVSGWYRNTHRFWCSALVSFIYDQLGWVDDIDWTLVSPGQLAGSCLRWKVPIEAPKVFI